MPVAPDERRDADDLGAAQTQHLFTFMSAGHLDCAKQLLEAGAGMTCVQYLTLHASATLLTALVFKDQVRFARQCACCHVPQPLWPA